MTEKYKHHRTVITRKMLLEVIVAKHFKLIRE